MDSVKYENMFRDIRAVEAEALTILNTKTE